jgi:concanavalin A-like lectin/glucanase superfamily protein
LVKTNKKSQKVESAAFHPDPPMVPSYNHALVLGWGGLVDTDLSFSEFFHEDHTIMVRFMPRYPYAYAGPFLAENGQGTYFIGQGDYRWGNGGYLRPGDPVLFVKIGNSFEYYLMPQVQRATWHHLAAVRTGNTFTMYLDGQKLDPALNITSQNLPQGNLRLGRRTDQRMVFRTPSLDGAGYVGQFYGLIDDVAVYRRPLNEQEITDLIAGLNRDGRLTGYETNLYAGWSFDVPGMNSETRKMPMELARRYSMAQPNSSLIQVSAVSRSDPMDGKAMDSYHVQWNLTLPFKLNETWEVKQGYDSQGGSHNGYASFCLDFIRSDLASSEGVILVSSAPGRVENVIEGNPQGSPNGNDVNFKFTKELTYGYLHIQQGSYSRFGFDPVPPQNKPEWLRPFVKRDIEVAAVGDTAAPGNPHLHFGTTALSNVSPGLITIPVAFSNYWVLEGNTWVFVPLGTPLNGQVIMRTDFTPTLQDMCNDLRTDIELLTGEIQYLQEELESEEDINRKLRIQREIREKRLRRSQLRKQAQDLGC